MAVTPYMHAIIMLKHTKSTTVLNDEVDFAEIAPSNVQRESDDEAEPTTESSDFAFFKPQSDSTTYMDIGPCIGAPSKETSQESLLEGRMPDTEYYSLMRSLNLTQQMILKHVLKCVKTGKQPLHLFITGGAGVGKSVLIRAMYQTLHRLLCSKEGQDPENTRILLCAPTGPAAYNINGLTNHKAFDIKANRDMFGKNQFLTSAQLNTLQVKYRDLEVVIIDEISMVGNRMFKLIDCRLKDIKGNQCVVWRSSYVSHWRSFSIGTCARWYNIQRSRCRLWTTGS